MNHYYETLSEYVAEVLTLPEEDKASCGQTFKPIFIPKNTIITPAGEVPKFHSFVVSGFVRNFHVDNQGNEVYSTAFLVCSMGGKCLRESVFKPKIKTTLA